MPLPDRGRSVAGPLAETAVLVALFLLHYLSFGRLDGPLHGPFEAFDQDSTYILRGLAAGEIYRWNPQNHLLYHVLIESTFVLWQSVFGPGLESAFRFLKLFTALTGFAFLLAMRWLFVELRLQLLPRLILLLLTGISVAIWFHASAFESHVLALPALAVYLYTVVRLRNRETRTWRDRALFILSLLVMGWTRIDLFRFAAVSALLLFVPSLRRLRKALALDLAAVMVLGLAGSAALASLYFEIPFHSGVPAVLERHDRKWLRSHLSDVANLTPANIGRVVRATTLYSIMMPIAPQSAERGFFAMPTYVIGPDWPRGEDGPSTRLFSMPARNLLHNGLALLVAIGLVAGFAVLPFAGLIRAVRGDPLPQIVIAQAIAGWLLYTFFNPFEPFLWTVEFVPLWMVFCAEGLRDRGRAAWIAAAVFSLLLGLHNWNAFYLPFR